MFPDDWFFRPHDFEIFREVVERLSCRRWEYSEGPTRFLSMLGWSNMAIEPWIGCRRSLADQRQRVLGELRLLLPRLSTLTRDIQTQAEDPSYGVSKVIAGPAREQSTLVPEVMADGTAGPEQPFV